MPRLVSYTISDREDGRFDVIATIEPDKVFRRDGFATLAEAEDWVDGLRVLMAALGAPVVQKTSPDIAVPQTPVRAPRRAG
ncbi:hypothetical protein [Methylorubrum suomiense]|uniref:PH domain-containing protein n=1 Tax=Methylorubrum suomiense TaxID=144191 RepID=A0ABQ4UUK2_9HYPH|nr:hypothetical protein BGCPKDLD_1260 [Methylorubrum suomiense]